MKINKKSWHYWLNNVTDSKLCPELQYGTVGLCGYFWGTVKSILKAVGIVLVCLFLLVVASLGVYLVLNALVFILTGVLGYPLFWVDMDNAVGVIVLLTIISIIAGFCMWVNGDLEFAPDYLKIKIEPSTIKDKEPSLFKSYYFAWKDKVCPLVELED
jgi:hypothetical protein